MNEHQNAPRPLLWILIALGSTVLIAVIASFAMVTTTQACNVHGYVMYGELITSNAFAESTNAGTFSDVLVDAVRQSNQSNNIKAILLEVDSYGGQPVAAEEIANALKRSEKPVVAVIRTAGTSAAYWAATGSDTIFASRNSDVGSIGVSISLLSEVEKNQKEGIRFISISSARYKNIGNPYAELTVEERELLQRDVNAIHENFVQTVSENRGIALETLQTIADGSTMLGQEALEFGLIDRIGDQYDAEQFIAELIGEEVSLCWI